MTKFLKKFERNFLVCSDCAYFINEEIIDERYPEIVKGKCKLHNKTVDNKWETNCKDNTYYCCCDQCKYFHENVYFDLNDEEDDFNCRYLCELTNISIKETDKVCEYFKITE